MDEFDFEELIADMLNITDEQREDDDIVENLFYDEFNITLDQGFALAKRLIMHTPKVQAGLSGRQFHAFISKTQPIMLMKVEGQSK